MERLKHNKLLWISIQGVVFFMWFCLACSLWGQAGKIKDLTPDEYDQWYSILTHQLSPDGKWVSYIKEYEQQTDTLVVQSTADSVKFYIPNGNRTAFSQQANWFFAQDNEGGLWKIDLLKGELKKENDVLDYQLSQNGTYLAFRQKEGQEGSKLIYQNLKDAKTRVFQNVLDYAFDATSHLLAVSQKTDNGYSLSVIENPQASLEEISSNQSNPYSNLVWSPQGKSLAFMEVMDDTHKIHWIRNLDARTLQSFDALKNGLAIPAKFRDVILFSEDGQKLFFKAANHMEIKEEEKPNPIQIWNTKDELLYPAYEIVKKSLLNPNLTICWNINGSWHYVGDKENIFTMYGTNAKYAYSYSQKEQLLASAEREAPLNIYRYNTDTGQRKLVYQKPVGSEFQLSPSGRYLAYFKDGDWWVYDANNGRYSNITFGMDVSFTNMEYDRPGIQPSYGHPGWTEDEKEIILYDRYDLWAVTPDGKNKRRITKGREEKKEYRLYHLLDYYYKNSRFSFQDTKIYDLEKGVIFHVHGADEKTGYFRYSDAQGLNAIVYKDCFVSELRMSADRSSWVYMEERFDNPPKLVYGGINTPSKTILQTNPQHFKYHWGRAELVHFEGPKGQPLKGVLYYPAKFNPKKKYPTITLYYEILSDRIHLYHNPSYYDYGWPNLSNFTTQGYFVFLPDIVFEIPDPGISAANCILAGLNKILERPYIDKEKLGAFGHSFGGYETLFLITQTDIFATAVAGAGAANMRSYYLSMAWMWRRPQTWRFEKQQWRMGDTYFNIPEAYERNSPINFVENVTTPLLSWAGKKDTNVNWEQQMEFFIALRKLKKEHIMVFYENDGHSLSNPENQKDMTNRLFDWYNHYLKGEPAPSWMTDTH